MPINILIILACVPLYVVNSFCDKHISSQDGNQHNMLYNGIKFLVGSLLLLPMTLMDDAPNVKIRGVKRIFSIRDIYKIVKRKEKRNGGTMEYD